jgi:hypothetical protein
MRKVSSCFLLMFCIAVGAAGCADKDEKRVAGRTASASTAPTTTVAVSLMRSTVVEAGTGLATSTFVARIDAPEALGVALRTPTNEELPLEASDGGGFVLSLTGPATAQDERFPRGGYTAVVDLPSGRDATTTVLLREPPAPPTLLAPTDLSIVDPARLVVRWFGTSTRHDVRVVDHASGEVLYLARDVGEQHLALPALEGGRRLRLEVLAVDAPFGAPSRAAAGVAVVVDGAP